MTEEFHLQLEEGAQVWLHKREDATHLLSVVVDKRRWANCEMTPQEMKAFAQALLEAAEALA